MFKLRSLFLSLTLCLSVVLFSTAPRVDAQPTAPAAAMMELGSAKSGKSTYSLQSSGNLESKQAQIAISVVTLRDDGKTNTGLAKVLTGKSKTVKQILAQLAEAFNRASPNITPDTPLTVIGHMDHGGELRVMSDEAGGVRFDYFSTSAPITQIRFNPEETAQLRKLLAPYL